MTKKPFTSLLMVASLVALAACEDAAIGDWESDSACGKEKMTVEDDNTGDGYIYLADEYGNCMKCDFKFDWEAKDDDKYSVDLEFETCNCNGVFKADLDCDINDDGDKLSCDATTVGTCPLDSSDWDKDE